MPLLLQLLSHLFFFFKFIYSIEAAVADIAANLGKTFLAKTRAKSLKLLIILLSTFYKKIDLIELF